MINRYQDLVEAYLSATYGSHRYRRVRAGLLKGLVDTLVTGKVPRAKLPDRQLVAMLRAVQRQLEADDYALTRAWYERQIYGTGRRSAASRWQVHSREIKFLENLWTELRYTRDQYRALLAKIKPVWCFDVDEIHEDIVIWLDDRAIEDIVLVALEAYAVPRRGVRFTETYGMCFGSTKSTDEKRPGHGRHTTRYINVSSVHIQLRAECYSNKVTYDLRSLETQMAVATHFFPQLDIVGDFHTHPYKNVNELRSMKGWRYSGEDEAVIPTWVLPLQSMGYHPRTSLLVGIAKGSQRITRPGRVTPNVVRFSIEKYHFYLACYRIIGNRYSDKHITLNSIALPGM
jgi:hypothetical protein